MNDRRTFLSHFVLCLAIVAAAFFAWRFGILQLVWDNQAAKWFGVAIATLFIGTAAWVGLLAWRVDSIKTWSNHQAFRNEALLEHADSSFCHDAIILFPSIGMLGTVTGLGIAFKAGVDTATLMAGASTAFYSTGCGLVAMILMMIMAGSLEAGIRRAGR